MENTSLVFSCSVDPFVDFERKVVLLSLENVRNLKIDRRLPSTRNNQKEQLKDREKII